MSEMKKFIRVLFRIVEAFSVIGAVALNICLNKKHKRDIETEKDFGRKIASYYHLLNKWLKFKQRGHSIEDYFHKNSIYSIAIYGYKELGERLYDDLKETDIEVKYIIDKNVGRVHAEVDVYGPDEKLPKVDAIVITATYYYDEIEDELYEMVDCPIISLEDLFV